ncbi:MAG TPA: hypothetical protein VE684_18005 [Crenalkalicoccus sp.]|nr:hypothetical protein [Crenalkalicoccus sp.]
MLACQTADSEEPVADHAALLLMLSYVEAECRRIGASDAARYAALAARLVAPGARVAGSVPFGSCVH